MSSGDVGAAEGRFRDVAGALLLGGASKRMGSDKAQRTFGGEVIATRLARMLDDLFEEVLLVGGEAPPEAPGHRVPDPEGPRCALRGLVGALDAARAPRVMVLATDLVGLTPELMLCLLALPEADVVLPESPDAGLQPLCALYRTGTVLERARARMAAGELSLPGLLEGLECTLLGGEDLAVVDPEGTALTNANTPSEWSAAERRLAEEPPR